MDSAKTASMSDEEEDLEALRLAALQTLKKSSNLSESAFNDQKSDAGSKRQRAGPPFRSGMPGHGNYANKRGRCYGHWATKNGQFHNRPVSSNLISLTPSLPPEPKKIKEINQDSKLTLPQDRYNNKVDFKSDKTDEKGSKFDRYKDSDDSEDEDSEDELLKSDSDDDSPLKLTRSDSLEALMQELDDEIQGITKPKDSEEKSKGKVKAKRKKVESEQESEKPAKLVEPVKEEKKSVEEPKKEVDSGKKPVPIEPQKRLKSPEPEPQQPPKKRRHTPQFKREFRGAARGNSRKFRRVTPPRSNPPPPPPFIAAPPVYSLPPFASGIIMNAAPFLDPRPMSPLHINAETLQTQTLAPLSPRSAAFVLQNRAIIEKRKRSPRRSYSRSPSPRNPRRSVSPRRRSLSPRAPIRRRSLTPIRKRSTSPFRKRSLSPLRKRSPRRRSLSPKKRSPKPFSPKQRAPSPKGKQFSPKRRSISPPRRRDRDRKVVTELVEGVSKLKPSIRERLGFKSKPEEKESLKEKSSEEQRPPEEDKPVDPILEARKKKFESNEIKIREGVIRLRPKAEVEETIAKSHEEKPENKVTEKLIPVQKSEDDEGLNEDLLIEDDELELDADHTHLFSDEESGSDNEGRFKVKQASSEKTTATVISFNKLVNGAKTELRPVKPKETRASRSRARSRSPRLKTERKPTKSITSELTQKSHSSKSESSTQVARKKFGVKSERHPKKFERKIEIKIKNPSKYKDREDKEVEIVNADDLGPRKVELGTENAKVEDDDETEIVVENDDGEVENICSSEGDLRAQLSKKRAEKLQSRTAVSREGGSSRLLQNALKHALPVKKPKKSKKKDLSSGEGKVPIHLRLGLSYDSDIFTSPTKSKKKSKKRKRIDAEEQV